MKIIFTSLIGLIFSISLQAQVYMNDDFSSWPQGWDNYATPCAGQYFAVQDLTIGSPTPCAKIDKSNCLAPCSGSLNAGIKKTIWLTPAAKEFIFSVDYEASSGTTTSSVTNAYLRIVDNTNNAVIVSTCLVCGGTLESNWRSYADTFALGCNGTNSVTVYLFTVDAWTGSPWCKATRFDNPKLNVTQTSATAPIELSIDSGYNPTCIGCNDGSIHYTYTGGVAPLNVTWTPNVGVAGINEITGLPADTYNVCVADSNNCSLCKTVVLSDPSTGIAGIKNEQIKLYPLPLTSFSYVELPETVLGNSMSLHIIDVVGRIKKEIKINDDKILLDRNDFKEGIYFMQLISMQGNVIYTRKFSVE